MQAEHRSWSTRGTAPAYHAPMRNASIVALSLFLSPLACSEDAPTRPDDGTVDVWETCVWDGQEIRSLCQTDLACAWNGVCVPKCEALEECEFEGFRSECGVNSDENVCRVLCNEKRECPQTGGVQLHCLGFYCVREP